MLCYSVYMCEYFGNSIAEKDFPRLSTRAQEQLALYERCYTVEGTPQARDKAVCAMADALYYFETAANGGLTTSSSVGSVSSSTHMPAMDLSPKAQAAELYRCANLYLSIYRGCRPC
ncbi:MAG: hypothetical protein RR336_02630 [Oscillospiraceae bacterium]